MTNEKYIVATTKPWNINAFNEIIKNYQGDWTLITDPNKLNISEVKAINPKYIFFPHWSEIVPDEILNSSTCICFHETDLPFGRGGSPIQNLIIRGHNKTLISAIKMTNKIDSGPVYIKEKLSLDGLAEEVFIRISKTVSKMILTIISNNIIPKKQVGDNTYFKRRTPSESRITENLSKLEDIFDHIRMLDAETYPKAFIEVNGFRYELSRSSMKTGELISDVKITKIIK